MKLLLISSIALNVPSRAEDAVILQKNSPAPFTGILMDNTMVNDLRKASVERDGLVNLNASLTRSMTLQDDIITRQNNQKITLLDQNDKLALRLGEERSIGTWERIGFMALGIAASGMAALAYKKAYQ